MGLYDRDYYRDEPRRNGKSLSGVALLILLNVGLFFVNIASGYALFPKLALSGALTTEPFQWYRCLTYAFAHADQDFLHILCNMLVLFFFGPPIEQRYGKSEFLCFYLTSAIFGGVVWNVLHWGQVATAVGASGAVTAIVILFSMNFPNIRVFLWGVLPLPAWVAGVLFVIWDMFGASNGGDNIAHEVHLSGAAFAVVYFLMKIRLVKVWVLRKMMNGTRRAPNSFRGEKSSTCSFTNSGHSRASTNSDVDFVELEKKVDDILRKISRSGEDSLTEKERETLRFASQEYQKRKGR